MNTGDDVYRRLQAKARSEAAKTGNHAPTAEYLMRYLLESFLDRLTRTEHAENFVLKGGILLAVYGIRRPTRDVDVEAIGAVVTPEHLERVMRDIADATVDDGVVFDMETLAFQEIREGAKYSGLRLRSRASIGPWSGVVAWDISTGDPIVPAPEKVLLPRMLGGEIQILGYRPETTIAEKGTHHNIDTAQLLAAARAVAKYRGIHLGPTAPRVVGYGTIAQQKWAAWRRKEGVEGISEESLDDQLHLVSSYLDPVFCARDLQPGTRVAYVDHVPP